MKYLPLRLLGCTLILLLAAACAPLKNWPPQPSGALPLPPRDQDLVELLSYYQELSGKSPLGLQQEQRFYHAALVVDRCSTARMRLGLVLLRLSELGQADESTQEIMPPCLPDQGDGRGIHLLAQLIHEQLQARAQAQSRQQDTSQKLDALKRDNQELRRQVDGLKAIERSLQNRHRE